MQLILLVIWTPLNIRQHLRQRIPMCQLHRRRQRQLAHQMLEAAEEASYLQPELASVVIV
jgi:hypothetical protein